MAAFGIFPKKVELQALMKYYDVNGDCQISYDEFLNGLKDDLSARRLNMVQKAFSRLDINNSGSLTVHDIHGIYDVSMNPDFLEGRKTRDEIFNEFLQNFEGARGNRDGCVTWQEF